MHVLSEQDLSADLAGRLCATSVKRRVNGAVGGRGDERVGNGERRRLAIAIAAGRHGRVQHGRELTLACERRRDANDARAGTGGARHRVLANANAATLRRHAHHADASGNGTPLLPAADTAARAAAHAAYAAAAHRAIERARRGRTRRRRGGRGRGRRRGVCELQRQRVHDPFAQLLELVLDERQVREEKLQEIVVSFASALSMLLLLLLLLSTEEGGCGGRDGRRRARVGRASGGEHVGEGRTGGRLCKCVVTSVCAARTVVCCVRAELIAGSGCCCC